MPKVVTKYVRQSGSPPKSKKPQLPPQYVLSSSPSSESAPIRRCSTKWNAAAASSDNEVEESIEKPRSKRRSETEVILPSRKQSNSARHSPDPLDSLPKMMEANDPAAITTECSDGPASVRQAVSSSVALDNQHDIASGSTRRVSSRVQDHKTKAEADKAEKRRKRALGKAVKARKKTEVPPERRAQAMANDGMTHGVTTAKTNEAFPLPAEGLNLDAVSSDVLVSRREEQDATAHGSSHRIPMHPVSPDQLAARKSRFSSQIVEKAEKSKKRKADAIEPVTDDLVSRDKDASRKRPANKRTGKDARKTKSKARSPIKASVATDMPITVSPRMVESDPVCEEEEAKGDDPGLVEKQVTSKRRRRPR